MVVSILSRRVADACATVRSQERRIACRSVGRTTVPFCPVGRTAITAVCSEGRCHASYERQEGCEDAQTDPHQEQTALCEASCGQCYAEAAAPQRTRRRHKQRRHCRNNTSSTSPRCCFAPRTPLGCAPVPLRRLGAVRDPCCAVRPQRRTAGCSSRQWRYRSVELRVWVGAVHGTFLWVLWHRLLVWPSHHSPPTRFWTSVSRLGLNAACGPAQGGCSSVPRVGLCFGWKRASVVWWRLERTAV